MRACLRSHAGPTIGAWLLIHPSTPLFWLSFVQFFIAFRIRLGISHPTIPHLSHCQCGLPSMIWVSTCFVACVCDSGRITTHDMF